MFSFNIYLASAMRQDNFSLLRTQQFLFSGIVGFNWDVEMAVGMCRETTD